MPGSPPAMRTVLDLMQGLPSIIVGLLFFGLLVVGNGPSGYRGVARAGHDHAAAGRTLQPGGDPARPDGPCARAPTRSAYRAGARWSGSSCPRRWAGSSPVRSSPSAARPARRRRCSRWTRSGTPTRVRAQPVRARRASPTSPSTSSTRTSRRDPASVQRAWGAALVLLIMILLANFAARALLARNRRKLAR